MQERRSGNVVACRIERVASAPDGEYGVVQIRPVYQLFVDVQVGDAVVPLRRVYYGRPHTAVGDAVELVWRRGRPWRATNLTTGEVLLDRRLDSAARWVSSIIVAAAVGLAALVVML